MQDLLALTLFQCFMRNMKIKSMTSSTAFLDYYRANIASWTRACWAKYQKEISSRRRMSRDLASYSPCLLIPMSKQIWTLLSALWPPQIFPVHIVVAIEAIYIAALVIYIVHHFSFAEKRKFKHGSTILTMLMFHFTSSAPVEICGSPQNVYKMIPKMLQ